MERLSNGNYVVGPEELANIIATAIYEYRKTEGAKSQILYRDDMRKDLNISAEHFRHILNHPQRPPVIGTGRKLQISRQDWEAWKNDKKKGWGTFKVRKA